MGADRPSTSSNHVVKVMISGQQARTSMQPPGIPDDEADRLIALYRLNLLDTAPEESFDRVTRLAARALHVPFLLVSLIDEHRQWFKSSVGLDAKETSREVSFCGHVVFNRRALVVPDATRDPRFAGNPLVSGPPHIRAYAGVPLFTRDDQPIGTLCAIDTLVRDFTEDEVDSLRDHAGIVEELIQARDASLLALGTLKYVAERERLFRATFEDASFGIAHLDLNGVLRRMNRLGCALLGQPRVNLQAHCLFDLIHPDDAQRNQALIAKAISGEISRYHIDLRTRRQDGLYQPIKLDVSIHQDLAPRPDYLLVSIAAAPPPA